MKETTPDLTRISKYLSLILRHKPEVIGIQLDAHGWADVNALLAGVSRKYPINRDILDEIVGRDEKQRYAFSEDGTRTLHPGGCGTPRDRAAGDAVPRYGPAVCRLHRGPGTAPQKPPVCPPLTESGNSGESRTPARRACDLPGGCRTDAPGRISLLFVRQWCLADKGGSCGLPETLRG